MAKKQNKGKKELVYAPIVYQPITETIEKNYMPYVMSVIVSRAIPEIDGLKPSHRKLLYTMYKMGLLTGPRTKSANIVGQTMKLNPHGDASIYETMVRLTRGNATLLHPLVDSKGSFGKQYSSEMKYAASRYTAIRSSTSTDNKTERITIQAMAKKQNKGKKELVYAPIVYQPITETIEKNYMPYVMSVIVSRAIPEIDGLKPSHRKLLYTMYKMGLLTGPRTKSANIVGQTMKLNPHGDASIYETMVRLTRGNATLLHPLVDSKGSFGKQYSSEMKYAASRYTECKLDAICAELFAGIDKNAVDMIDNYDATMKEPVLLPTTFPNILVMPNMGIAVGMASNICSFNLAEICDGTIALLRKPNLSVDKMMELVKAPDFSGGGVLLYDEEQIRQIYTTGQGSVRLRGRYVYDKTHNCIEILQIPYSTTVEIIMAKLDTMFKEGKLKEVSDYRDETDLSGLKLTMRSSAGIGLCSGAKAGCVPSISPLISSTIPSSRRASKRLSIFELRTSRETSVPI